MKLLDLIQDGAVLTAEVPGGARMLLGPYAVIQSGRLVFYDLTSERARSLKFDAFEWPHEHGVWLIQAGDRVAYLGRVADDSPAAGEAWQLRWATQLPAEKARLLAVFRGAIDSLSDENSGG